MNILLTADPELPVPPRLYGGIERIVDMIARELAARGHRVVLLAHPDSTTPVTRIAYRGRHSASKRALLLHTAQLVGAVRQHEIDVVHSFGRLAYLTPLLPSRLPKLQSYQRPVSPRSVRLGTRLSRGSLTFTACSEWLARRGAAHGGAWHAIPNGVPRASYDFAPTVAADAPLVFLGRIERIKGTHTAIEVARQSGRRLVIAGNVVRDGGEAEHYFEEAIAPRVDGEQVRYIGPVDDTQKNALLGGAAALLMPIEWDEPFGIVMVEALACGTPVLAFPRGSAPEVVLEGESGFLCDGVAEMTTRVGALARIDRAACRTRFEQHYSGTVITDAYEALYRRLSASI